jgi:hypothetical protein
MNSGKKKKFQIDVTMVFKFFFNKAIFSPLFITHGLPHQFKTFFGFIYLAS